MTNEKPNPESQAAIEAKFEAIAREVLGIPTLKVRHSDQADFHELSVVRIQRALAAAYEAGRRANQ
jgi:hypothetical protein